MREISKEEQKCLILDILIDFDKVCKNNNIPYSLAYGTLLGAVRHKGFIPWDDDIDVIVTRENYVKLIDILNAKLQTNHKFICVENTKGFSAPLGKIIDNTTLLKEQGHYSDKIDLGVYIDVFVYDWIPVGKYEQNIVLNKAVFLTKLWSFFGNNYGKHNVIIKKIRGILNKTPLARYVSLYVNSWASSGTYEKKMMAALVYGVHDRRKNTMLFSDLQNLKVYEFEGYHFWGIKNSDYYLKQWYGDYMKLPPIEKRVSNHNTIVYMKED